MPEAERSPDERWTYADYSRWPEDERWELIEGQAWSMSPAPLLRHQRIARKLFTRLANLLEGKTCEVFIAPFDILLPSGDEDDEDVETVVQPDIAVYCDRSRLTERGGRGAPDLVIEILSPSTAKRDLNDKFRLYEKHGVREYWVVDPGNKSIQLWSIKADGRYDDGELSESLGERGSIESRVLEGFAVEPGELFANLD